MNKLNSQKGFAMPMIIAIVALASKFGVAYQHTKVFLKNGQRIVKSPESWSKEQHLSEINKALTQ